MMPMDPHDGSNKRAEKYNVNFGGPPPINPPDTTSSEAMKLQLQPAASQIPSSEWPVAPSGGEWTEGRAAADQ